MTEIPTIQLECKKDSIKQLQNGDGKLTLTVNAEDMNIAIASLWAASMGTRYQVVMVEIGDDEVPIDREQPKSGDPVKSVKGYAKPPMTESQRCGMLCGDTAFQEWLAVNFPQQWNFFFVNKADPSEAAACVVRNLLKITSRRELDDNRKAVTLQAWQAMRSAFEEDIGQMAREKELVPLPSSPYGGENG